MSYELCATKDFGPRVPSWVKISYIKLGSLNQTGLARLDKAESYANGSAGCELGQKLTSRGGV